MEKPCDDDDIVLTVLSCMRDLPPGVSAMWRDRYEAWASAIPSDIEQKRNSGFGGGETRKMTLSGENGTSVCVHIFGGTFGDGLAPVNSRFKARLRAAHAAFSSAGLAAPRFGEWSTGFVEPWLDGGAVGTPGLEIDWHKV